MEKRYKVMKLSPDEDEARVVKSYTLMSDAETHASLSHVTGGNGASFWVFDSKATREPVK